MNESFRYIAKILSVIMLITLKLSELPFTTIMLEGFVCEEDEIDGNYTLTEVYCDDIYHLTKVGISTILLATYLVLMTL